MAACCLFLYQSVSARVPSKKQLGKADTALDTSIRKQVILKKWLRGNYKISYLEKSTSCCCQRKGNMALTSLSPCRPDTNESLGRISEHGCQGFWECNCQVSCYLHTGRRKTKQGGSDAKLPTHNM